MKIVVVGAAGRTGGAVVKEALRRGMDVVALARRPEAVAEAVPAQSTRLQLVQGDVLKPGDWQLSFAGADAVISALGSVAGKGAAAKDPVRTYSDGITAILAAMATHNVPKIAVISAFPLAGKDEAGLLQRAVVFPILRSFFGNSYKDMARMEEILSRCDADWTVLRPPMLTNGKATGRYRTSLDPGAKPGARITRSDLARALLDSVSDPRFTRRTITVFG